MDRKWMSANRLTKEYENGVKEFVEFAVMNAKDPNRVVCPCLKCCFGKRVRADELEGHLVWYGIDQSYTCWIRHGEKINGNTRTDTYASTDFDTDIYESDRVEEIAKAVEEDLRDCPKMCQGSCLIKILVTEFVAKHFNLNFSRQLSDQDCVNDLLFVVFLSSRYLIHIETMYLKAWRLILLWLDLKC